MLTVNLFILACVLLVAISVRGTLQLSGDFTDEDYDDLSGGQSSHVYNRHQSKRVNLTADRIQDYLLSLHSKVLASNDVLTVKERKVFAPKKDKFLVNVIKPNKSTPKELQSDQPATNDHEQHLSVSTSTPKPVTTSKPMYLNYWNNEPSQQHAPHSWNCEFKSNHDCGIYNDISVGEFFHLESRNFFRNFNWKSWYLMLNASAIPNDAVGARLITPYMDTKNASQGCLSVQYITMASGITRVALYQQDKGNHCIWSKEPKEKSSSEVPVKHQFDFTIDLFRGSPRFFFELYLDLSQPSAKETIFALANMRLAYRPCRNSNANYCRPVKTAPEYDASIP